MMLVLMSNRLPRTCMAGSNGGSYCTLHLLLSGDHISPELSLSASWIVLVGRDSAPCERDSRRRPSLHDLGCLTSAARFVTIGILSADVMRIEEVEVSVELGSCCICFAECRTFQSQPLPAPPHIHNPYRILLVHWNLHLPAPASTLAPAVKYNDPDLNAGRSDPRLCLTIP
jgi:hypothetical protein